MKAAKPAAKPSAAMHKMDGKGRDALHRMMNDGLPIKDYQKLTVTQIRSHVHELTAAQRRTVRAYETSHKNRKGVLEALSGRLH
ncbi:hypothetical protein GJ700_17920 [Duganella sp. FT92W]|uniref:DUF8129 domain-containing protein n=1 Tax=Pseudoduganella rivuli TaxID=2666085 RepID=A0A7X2LU52_9BURK|nr:hypothetical protein [Pseudoduganella rivuli]MRV73593.1 hypothetical protein [Pseudoduganella rivuli]